MTERWLDNIENREQNVLTFLDLSATFNCVEHRTLVEKMSIYGFSDSSTNLIWNYVAGRSQLVTVGKKETIEL